MFVLAWLRGTFAPKLYLFESTAARVWKVESTHFTILMRILLINIHPWQKRQPHVFLPHLPHILSKHFITWRASARGPPSWAIVSAPSILSTPHNTSMVPSCSRYPVVGWEYPQRARHSQWEVTSRFTQDCLIQWNLPQIHHPRSTTAQPDDMTPGTPTEVFSCTSNP